MFENTVVHKGIARVYVSAGMEYKVLYKLPRHT